VAWLIVEVTAAAGLTPSLVLVALGVALSNDAAVATAAGLPVIAVLAVKPLGRFW
jgi:hypothetical protein